MPDFLQRLLTAPVTPHHASMSEAHSPPVSPAKRSVKRPTRPTLLTKKSRGGDITPRASPTSLDQTVEDLQTLDMAASFLQHCAFCEKQIMHPSNNMLYCSQACRRKDTNKPMSLPSTPAVSPPSTAPSSPRAILPPSTPTGISYMDYSSTRFPADVHNAKSDLDPTEWKPKGTRNLRNSEAHRYLSQFHRASMSTSDDNEKIETTRPPIHRSHTSMTSRMSTPSLASTPTTATSSLSMDYDFSTRALPPRHNPMYSASAGMTKDIGLVTPYIVPGVGVGPISVDCSWEKKPVVKRVGGEKDGLLSKSMAK